MSQCLVTYNSHACNMLLNSLALFVDMFTKKPNTNGALLTSAVQCFSIHLNW